MRTLLIEPSEADATSADALLAAGHPVVRCHEPGAPAFPCAALDGGGCPLEAGAPVELCVAVGEREAAAADSGATCALRAGIPLVLVGASPDDPLAPWAEPCGDLAGLEGPDGAASRAIAASARRRAAPLQAEVVRVLDALGVDAGEVSVTVARRGDTADVTVRTERPLERRSAGAVAARVHAVDRLGTWPTTKLTVALAADA